MADDIIQRLERIEANMVTKANLANLATHDDLIRELASIATNVNDLRAELRTNNDALRVQIQELTAMIRPLAEGLSSSPELFDGLADSIRRIEDRQPK
jgi:phage shock protein A